MFEQFIKPELLVLIVVLYVIGLGLKSAQWFPDKDIPFVLNAIGIALAFIWVLANTQPVMPRDYFLMVFTAVVQGVLVAGASVNANQLYKQATKDGE